MGVASTAGFSRMFSIQLFIFTLHCHNLRGIIAKIEGCRDIIPHSFVRGETLKTDNAKNAI